MREGSNLRDRIKYMMGKGFREDLNLFKTNVDIVLFDQHHKIKDRRLVHNTMKNAGLYGAADQLLAAPSLVKPGWMELGTGAPAATLLGAFIAGSRVALTSKTRSNAIVTMIGDWGAGVGTGAITEAGLFDVVTENTVNMWCSAAFAVINKGALDILQITWTITYS